MGKKGVCFKLTPKGNKRVLDLISCQQGINVFYFLILSSHYLYLNIKKQHKQAPTTSKKPYFYLKMSF